MMSGNYARQLLQMHRVLLGATLVLVCAFQVLMFMLFEALDMPTLLQEVVGRMPPPVQQLFGDQFISQYTIGGAVALGFNHPLILVTLLTVAISLPIRHLAGAIENGTLELVLTMPVKRVRIASSLWLSIGFFLLLLVLACLTGTRIGMLLFPESGDLDFSAVATMGMNLWLLAFAVSSYSLLMSATAREASRASQSAAGLTIFFYFLNFAVQIWPAIDFLAPFTPFDYYEPQEIMRGATGWIRDGAVLLAVALASGGLALRRIHRRDVP